MVSDVEQTVFDCLFFYQLLLSGREDADAVVVGVVERDLAAYGHAGAVVGGLDSCLQNRASDVVWQGKIASEKDAKGAKKGERER